MLRLRRQNGAELRFVHIDRFQGKAMTMERHRILYRGGQGELEEKKSRFIATTCPTESEEEALAFIERTKKQYWDARHNCSAYVIGLHNEIQRCSDDGEPSQTAGRPMLDVILGAGIRNMTVVVTRYFGGTLLGTGGLVRAYSEAVQKGLAASTVIEKIPARMVTLCTDYGGIGKLKYIAAGMGLTELDSRYTAAAELDYLVPLPLVDTLKNKITDATSGQCGIVEGKECYYGIADGEPIVF